MVVLLVTTIPAAVIVVLVSLIIIYKRRKTLKEVLISKNQERITEEQEDLISEKVFCQLCGEEILDEEGEYCSKCGGALK